MGISFDINYDMNCCWCDDRLIGQIDCGVVSGSGSGGGGMRYEARASSAAVNRSRSLQLHTFTGCYIVIQHLMIISISAYQHIT